jgi:hypothetical protein
MRIAFKAGKSVKNAFPGRNTEADTCKKAVYFRQGAATL